MKKRFELLVFDWDGTLMDSASSIVHSIQAACRDIGVEAPDRARASHVIGLGLQDALAHAAPGLAPGDYGRLAERYRHHFLALDAAIPLFPGTDAMLERLSRRGHTLAIATGKSRAGLERALKATAMQHHFPYWRCADQCASKPAPDMLRELMDMAGIDAQSTLMVGDTTHDLQMAGNAGVAAVAVCHGAHPRENLLALQPLACVANTAELTEWLLSHA